MNRYGTHGKREWRGATALLALTLAGGLLLTGCGGTDDASDGAKDTAADSRGGSGMPAPDRPRGEGEQRYDGGTSAPGSGEGEKNGDSREIAPDPDYLSTFALDVDTASYGYARRTLSEGRLPDPATVRPEEFVNSFRQDYERPDGDGFSVTVDGARTDDEDWSLVRVGLATRPAERQSERPPAALTFVIDISGSMGEPGRLDLAQEALGTMTDRLRDDDSVALVTFSDEAETVLPMTRLGDHRGRVHDAIDGLEPTDSTNLGAGMETGYETAVEGRREGATNRVVLVSDALANTGDTDADTILERIATERREHGITLFGVGVGSDYGDALMERLADKGDGHTTYVSTTEDAREVFSEQLPRHIELTARDAKAQVAFDPETVAEFRLVGYDNRQVADEDFRDDRVDGGEVGPGHTVTALYAVRTRPGADGHLATATVRWLDPDSRTPHEESGDVASDALDGSVWESGRGLRVTATAAYFADALRSPGGDGGSLPGAPGLSELSERADGLADRTENADLRELAEAIEEANRLA
ncbi:von Willebrand factor type A domain-containing protein [Streptomyces sp. ME02-6987-2C]|uniref:vWA domain-containing protein n=1 Tax=unclassified Streptomyces TaxID=2593676 RepID=UPI0029A8FE4D|nr:MULTISPECIES: von Willebrand factor type A domain-containing protein [unclassified Streptomyces]MDX3369303.1 von Willebrand factor type A domain-containing protein [Streptomyces sp. ME02-6987-2C]MDX3420153.1 von Willebrand factor type A domain-containing protein [Streptomyces sp. ME02-6985-2c]